VYRLFVIIPAVGVLALCYQPEASDLGERYLPEVTTLLAGSKYRAVPQVGGRKILGGLSVATLALPPSTTSTAGTSFLSTSTATLASYTLPPVVSKTNASVSTTPYVSSSPIILTNPPPPSPSPPSPTPTPTPQNNPLGAVSGLRLCPALCLVLLPTPFMHAN
jgi:hypothetical protein